MLLQVGLYVLNKATRLIPAPNFSDTAQSLDTKCNYEPMNSCVVLLFRRLQKKVHQWLALGDSFMAVQVSEEKVLRDNFRTTIDMCGMVVLMAILRGKQQKDCNKL